MTTPAIRVVARTTECPLCGASPGRRCTTTGGVRARDPHTVRIRAAYQKEQS